MFRSISYHLTLNRLMRSRRQTQAAFRKQFQELRKQPHSPDDIEGMRYQEMYEIELIDDDISALITGYLVEKAQRLFLPVPDHNDEASWRESAISTGRVVLSDRGIADLRALVRGEQRSRWEFAVTGVVVATGLIGAATGLVAVLKQ